MNGESTQADEFLDKPASHVCATMPAHHALVEQRPEMRSWRAELERFTQRFVATSAALGPQRVMAIRTVVHIVHRNPDRVTDAQVRSQLDVLNEDFRATNIDLAHVPPAYQVLVGDAGIEFELKPEDIHRVETSKSSFNYCLEEVKSAAMGGADPTEPDKAMNLWVCSLKNNVKGYAHFPGAPADVDGVVVHWRCFGVGGTALEPNHRGRICTHEVGHYLNLFHVWGALAWNSCTDDDFVADTPKQLGPNYGADFKGPRITCDNGPDGDMYMNYMDYVDDEVMCMFTKGQVARMRAALYGPRRGIWR